MHRLEWPSQNWIIVVVDLGADVSNVVDVCLSKTSKSGLVCLGLVASEERQILGVLTLVEGIARVGKGSRGDRARLMNRPGEQGLGVFAVVVEVVDSHRVATSRSTANSNRLAITSKRANVLLHKLQKIVLISDSKVQQTFILKKLRGQETKRVETIVEVDDHNGFFG